MANRVDFYTDDYNDLVNQKGMKVDWEQAIVCECLSGDSHQPDFGCKLCNGSGFRYLPPKSIRVISTTFSSSVKLESIGVREPGTAYITPPSDVIMGYRDRLKFVDFQCKYSETITIDLETKFSDRTHRNIKSVLFLVQGDSQYECGVDFEITKDEFHIKWLDDRTLPSGNLSILYLTTPSYLVVDLLHELRATYVKHKVPDEEFREFPKQYQVRREDFIYGVEEPVENTVDPETDEPEASLNEYDY